MSSGKRAAFDDPEIVERFADLVIKTPANLHPGLLSDLDPSRVGRDQLPSVRETGKVVNERTTNWTAVPCPTRPWARLVHPDLDPEDAWVTLCDQILHVCRLDTEDPIAAWSERAEVLVSAAARVTERRFDALRFVGPGTDLT